LVCRIRLLGLRGRVIRRAWVEMDEWWKSRYQASCRGFTHALCGSARTISLFAIAYRCDATSPITQQGCYARKGLNQPRERQRRESCRRYPTVICLRVPHSAAQARPVQVRQSWAKIPVNPEGVHLSMGKGVREETDGRTDALSSRTESHLKAIFQRACEISRCKAYILPHRVCEVIVLFTPPCMGIHM
jgi:hypothetical protein